MLRLLVALSVLSISLLQTSTLGTSTDVSRLALSRPTVVGELDLGKLKGELRQVGWGPARSGAIAFTNRDGRLFLLDQAKHKRPVSGAKDAMLPAWTMDGSRLAWVQKQTQEVHARVRRCQ